MKYDSHLYGQPALITSQPQAWPGLRVERYQLPAMALPAHYHQHHLLLLYQPLAPIITRRQQGNQWEVTRFQTGDLGLYPGGEYGSVAWDGPTDTIHLYLDDQRLEEMARQQLGLTRFSLHSRFCFQDPLLTALGHQLLSVISTPQPLGLLYIESLHTALCYHLITHHAHAEHRVRSTTSLSATVLARVKAYLEDNAEGPVTLQALAELANLSVFHFARRFKQTTGLSPYQYVLTWKVERAKQLLQANSLPLVAISTLLGFASPAHFSATFKRIAGQHGDFSETDHPISEMADH